jgi:hypothetical protein
MQEATEDYREGRGLSLYRSGGSDIYISLYNYTTVIQSSRRKARFSLATVDWAVQAEE